MSDQKAVGPKPSIPIDIPPEEIDKRHAFWDSQPVPKLTDAESGDCGPINPSVKLEDIRQTPYRLADGFTWVELDLANDEDGNQLYNLLEKHYVEDDDGCFRFQYSLESLRWALMPPSYRKDWHVGIKYEDKLVAFISAVPSKLKVYKDTFVVSEVNFLCVHKSLRSKRLAPVLIREITRRCNLENIWQALYTAGVFLPRPVGSCQYFHRSLNVAKLIDCGFTRLQGSETLAGAQKRLNVPAAFTVPSIRLMTEADVPAVTALYRELMSSESISMHLIMDEADVKYWLLPRKNVLYTYVKEDENGIVTDFFSFYSLPSTVIRFNAEHTTLNIAYNWYSGGKTLSRKELLYQSLIAAKEEHFDVFNALDLLGNHVAFQELMFGPGDGNLKYYLYNWKCPQIPHSAVGVILM